MRNKQSRFTKDSISHSPTIATLGVLVWLLLNLLPVREANGQGTIVFNNRISGAAFNQTGHIWGPASPDPYLSLIGLGPNDTPSGPTPFGSANGMFLIGQGTNGDTSTRQDIYHLGYATTFAQLIGALGSNQPESSLVPLAGVTTFRTGTSLGDVAAINSTFLNNPASMDAPWATIEIVAWDNSSGLLPTWTEAWAAWQGGVPGAYGRSAPFNVANIGGTANFAPVLTSAGTISGFSFNLIWVPEPSTCALVGLGTVALLISRRRR